MAKTEQKVVTGRCRTHGVVQATKTVPKLSFPFVYFAIRRAMVPALCPHCGAKLTKA